MPGTPTTKYGIPTLAGTTLARDIDTEVNAGLNAIDGKMVGYSAGTLASRPTSTVGSPGIAGRRYRATDTGQEFIDTGTSWVEIVRASACRLSKSATQAVANNTNDLVIWQTELEDAAGMHAANAAYVVVPEGGLYVASCGIEWSTVGAGTRLVTLAALDAGFSTFRTARSNENAAGQVPTHSLTLIERMTAGMMFKVEAGVVSDASGGTINNTGGTWFSVARIG